MSLLHDHSCECTKSELDLFVLPPTQTSIEKGQWVEYQPIANISDGGPIEFHISGSSEDYMDLAQTQLYVKAKITLENGEDLPDDANVGPVNLFLQSLFNQIDVSLNERLISSSTPTYSYRAMIETLLSYGKEAKESHLTSALFYKDTPGNMEALGPLAEGDVINLGLKKRYAFTKGSKVVDMFGAIHSDIFFQEKYLLNGVTMKLKLNKSKDEFCLMAGDVNIKYKVVLKNVSLFVRKVKVNPAVSLGHARALEKATAKYPIRRVVTKMMSIPIGNMSFVQDHIFLGQLPKKIIIGCVRNTAFNGSYTENPYNFDHFGLNFLAVYLDGEQIPYKPLKPNFVSSQYIRAYHTLFSGTGKANHDEGNAISRDDYPKGYTLYAFDLTPDVSSGGHFNLVKQGNLRMELQFASPLTKTVNVLVYAELDNIIEIDKARNVIFDYTS